jgi:hypothetical protein
MAKTNYSPTFPMFPGDAAAVTPSDTAELATPAVIYVGISGAVRVTTAQGTEVTFTGVAPGFVIPVQIRKVCATGTSALNMVAIF